MGQKLNDKVVRDLAEPTSGNRIVYDAEVRGFGARITAGGSRSFILNYRINGRERRHTIGQFPTWSVRSAREEAAKLKRDIDRGHDPLAEREKARTAPTVAELAERYLAEHAERKKKPRSFEEDRRNLRLHVAPKIGSLPVSAVTQDDIARLHHGMSASPVGANRVLALLSKMFGLAETWGLRPQNTNPCRGIDRFPERSRERLVTAEELARLGDALSAYRGHWAGPAAIRLLALTGARKSEVLTLRWSFIDFNRGVADLPDSKSGSKTITLGAPALAVLAELPRVEGNPYVLPAARPRRIGGNSSGIPVAATGHFVQLQTVWESVCRAAGLSDLRMHDLRHGFASVGAMGGDSLFIIGKLLGHADSKTSERYAHFSPDPLRDAADRISRKVAAALDGKKAELLKLKLEGSEG
jgi:integrase